MFGKALSDSWRCRFWFIQGFNLRACLLRRRATRVQVVGLSKGFCSWELRSNLHAFHRCGVWSKIRAVTRCRGQVSHVLHSWKLLLSYSAKFLMSSSKGFDAKWLWSNNAWVRSASVACRQC